MRIRAATEKAVYRTAADEASLLCGKRPGHRESAEKRELRPAGG